MGIHSFAAQPIFVSMLLLRFPHLLWGDYLPSLDNILVFFVAPPIAKNLSTRKPNRRVFTSPGPATSAKLFPT